MQERMPDSRDVARAAIMLAMTATREEESAQKQRMIQQGIRAAASDFGGDFVGIVPAQCGFVWVADIVC